MQNMENVYKEHSKLVYKYLFCLTHNSELAEELTQDTFLYAIKSIENFKNNCKMSTWLCQIAKHLWYKEIKKARIRNTIHIDEISKTIESEENIEDKIIKRDERGILYKKIESLPEEIKEVVYLRIIGDLSFREIGDLVGKNENWARVTFYRGKEKMKEGGYNEKE